MMVGQTAQKLVVKLAALQAGSWAKLLAERWVDMLVALMGQTLAV